jgi:hypothetical protein
MSAWLSYYKKNDKHHWLPGLLSFQRKIIDSAKQNYRSTAGYIVQLAKLSQFEEYLAKHGKFQIHKFIKSASTYTTY